MNNYEKKNMKIAYLMTPITFGGAERVNLNFLKNVDRDKFTIEPIIFLRPWEPEIYFETELKRMEYNYSSIPVAKSIKQDLFRVVRCFIMLYKLVHGKSYDLIHTHGYLADILGVVVSKICRIPIISTCHGFIFEGKKLSFYNKLDCFALKHFDRIISVSDPLKLHLINNKVSKNKIIVIENTPDCGECLDYVSQRCYALRSDIGVSSDEILIGYIGRLSPEKGIRYLIESIQFLADPTQTYKLVVIGDGPQENELKELVIRKNMIDKVIFTGFQKNIAEWLTAIDIFVLPSLTEGTPMVILEAMAYGVPCIATSVGGIPQIIDTGVDGILVSPENHKEISDAIYDLCTDAKKRSSISLNAKIKIESKYNLMDWKRKIEETYLKILKAV